MEGKDDPQNTPRDKILIGIAYEYYQMHIFPACPRTLQFKLNYCIKIVVPLRIPGMMIISSFKSSRIKPALGL